MRGRSAPFQPDVNSHEVTIFLARIHLEVLKALTFQSNRTPGSLNTGITTAPNTHAIHSSQR